MWISWENKLLADVSKQQCLQRSGYSLWYRSYMYETTAVIFYFRCMVKISEKRDGKISSIYSEPACGPSLDSSFTLALLGADRIGGSQAPEGCSHHPRHCHPPLPHHCGFFYALRQPSYLFMLLYNMISQTIPQKYFIELK